MDDQDEPARELSREERFRWGECPVCRAPHGVFCDMRGGVTIFDVGCGEVRQGRWHKGVHHARLERAPTAALAPAEPESHGQRRSS